MNKIENKFIDFILSPEYRKSRTILFVLALALLSTDLAINQPRFGITLESSILTIVVYNVIVVGTMLVNAGIAVPRLLLKDKLALYFLSVVFLVIFMSAGLILLQVLCLGLYNDFSNINKYFVFLNLSSSFILILLMFAGTTTFMLFRHWLNSTIRIAELESATLQSELKYLKNQINPHFLFNTLNNAHVLFHENKPEASGILYKLEDLLRYQINNTSNDKIRLSSDIAFLNDYLNLEKVRRDNFNFIIKQEGMIEQLELPPFLFIPFVENAVKHSQDSDQPSYIYLKFGMKGNVFSFQCENSLPADACKDIRPGGIGLKNIRRRLELLYPDKHRLELVETDRNYIVNLQIILEEV